MFFKAYAVDFNFYYGDVNSYLFLKRMLCWLMKSWTFWLFLGNIWCIEGLISKFLKIMIFFVSIFCCVLLAFF